MNLSALPSLIKAFFILLSSVYTYGRILNIHLNRKTYFITILFSLLSSLTMRFTQNSISPYSILLMSLFVTLFCSIIYKKKLSLSLCLSILSIGSSYALFASLVFITSPISFLILLYKLPEHFSAIIVLFIIGLLQNILLYFLFQTKRLCNGIPEIANAFPENTSIFIALLLIVFSSALFIEANPKRTYLLLFAFILALGIIIWLWWQKTIQTTYINKNNSQQIDILEGKLQERDAELERLSKIIHKDNKLLAALELSTREILTDTSSEKAQSLLQELNRFSKERSETLHAYESGHETLPETGLFSVDTMLGYLHQRALKHKIDFQLNLEGEIAGITDVISEEDLRTIIADLGENAIIATRESEVKNIRLSIERKTDGYALYFYDSGEPFAAEVLENFGKQRCTTHAETGGSGIGLVTTSELTAKYQGEFYITDEDITQPYTKCVVVLLKQRR